MKRKSFVMAAIVAAGFLLGTAGQSQASIILTSESQLSAGDQTLSAPAGNNLLPSPFVIPYNGGTASFSDVSSFNHSNVIQTTTEQTVSGSGFFADFAPGDPLFQASGASGIAGPLELRFSSDITEVGTQFQRNSRGTFTAYISAFDASNNLIGNYTAPGANTDSHNDSAVFLGLRNTAGDPAIRRVLFNVTSNTANDPNFSAFAINQVSFGNNPTTAPVPEPSTYAMFGLGILSIVALQRRKRKTNPHGAPAFNGAC